MSQYISLEISAEQIGDLMAEDGNFALAMWREIAERSGMGALKDDASDLVAGLPHNEAQSIANEIIALGRAMKSGFNMENHEQI